MSLYRLSTGRPPSKAYAVRTGTLGDEPVIAWVKRMEAAALFRKSDALKLARRMKRVAVVRVEKAA